jgi:hypothetical protein
MKARWIILFLLILSAIVTVKFYVQKGVSIAEPAISAQQSSSNNSVVTESKSSQPSLAAHSSVNASSLSIYSKNSLSGEKVNALPEIIYFLNQLDKVVIPKIYLPEAKRDPSFNYLENKASVIRDKALDGDPYAAYIYADYVVKNNVKRATDDGTYSYEPNLKKRIASMDLAREFYIRAFRGGLSSAADEISRLYIKQDGSRIESLAWRKISFAVGESERYECLRNSTLCVVKDFNNLNRLEYFYPCLSRSGDSCTQNEYDIAMMLALEYADSFDFAINNRVDRETR